MKNIIYQIFLQTQRALRFESAPVKGKYWRKTLYFKARWRRIGEANTSN